MIADTTGLSSRSMMVFDLFCSGPKTSEDIAKRLDISKRQAGSAITSLRKRGYLFALDGDLYTVFPPVGKPRPDEAAAWMFNPVEQSIENVPA